MKSPEIKEASVDDIVVQPSRMRGLNEVKVKEIAASMERIGQISPILIRRIVMDDGPSNGSR